MITYLPTSYHSHQANGVLCTIQYGTWGYKLEAPEQKPKTFVCAGKAFSRKSETFPQAGKTFSQANEYHQTGLHSSSPDSRALVGISNVSRSQTNWSLKPR